ncbi:hypothetical protein [Clostridium sp.]|uniref:hypothetical protein n=1 Tax=Clostridium sp. TaxID=1506 RepID=UPI0026021D30|nr:hypothetical protein [Clostridium sp.]
MKDLNEILGLNLNQSEIFDINEEKLILLKDEGYFLKNDFYFWLLNKIIILENNQDNKALSYGYYLMSYYLFIILTPLYYEDLAFNYITKATNLDDNLIYKEWYLIFATLPENYIKVYDAIKTAEEVLEENPQSNLANAILEMF